MSNRCAKPGARRVCLFSSDLCVALGNQVGTGCPTVGNALPAPRTAATVGAVRQPWLKSLCSDHCELTPGKWSNRTWLRQRFGLTRTRESSEQIPNACCSASGAADMMGR